MLAAVPAFWPCRARAVSWARLAAHALHGAPGRAGTGTPTTVPCRPWAVPKGRAVGRAASPWAAWPYIQLGATRSYRNTVDYVIQ